MRNLISFISLSCLSFVDLCAIPIGNSTSSGSVSVGGTPNDMVIAVNSNLAVIDWNSYSIDNGQSVTYTRTGSQAFAVLNNVTGSSQSTIAGLLHAENNGIVYLVNPNGVVISSTGFISTGGFVASTLQLTSTFDPTGNMTFAGSSTQSVQNAGQIVSSSGDAILIGFRTVNTGSIRAANLAGMAAGTEVLLKPAGLSDRLFISTIVDNTSSGTGINNSGNLSGLNISLKADGNAYALAINHAGTLQATGCNNTTDGQIILVADPGSHPNGVVQVSGSIARTTGSVAGFGPDITVLGYEVAIQANGSLNASGDLGGGDITIGGLNAGIEGVTTNNVYIDPLAQIVTNGGTTGSGGTISYYGSASALVLGSLSARGGSSGGNGGTINGISPGYHGFEATVNLSAPAGTVGRTTLTSTDFLVSAPSNHGIYFQPPSYTSTSIPSVITTSVIQNVLNNSNLSIIAASGVSYGDITVVNPFTWSTANTNLTLNASNNLQVDAYVTATGASTAATEVLTLVGENVIIGNADFSQTEQNGFAIQSGSISARASDTLGVYGGSADNASSVLTTSGGTQTLSFGRAFDVKSGPSTGANAIVKGTTVNINCLPSSVGDINVVGNDCSKAIIDATGGTVNIGLIYRPVNVNITAGCCSTDDYALIGSPIGAASINSIITGNYTITGGSGGMNCIAGFLSASGAGNNFSIVGRNLNMTGGSGSNASGNAAIIRNYGSGSVTIAMALDINLTGGGDGSTGSGAHVRGNTVTVTAGRDIEITGGDGIMNAVSFQGLNGATVNVGRDFDIHGGPQLGASATIFTDNGDLVINNVGGPGGILDLASSSNGVNNSYSAIRVIGNGDIHIGRATPFRQINITAGGVGSSSYSLIELIGRGNIIVNALRDVNILGGNDGVQAFAGIINRGIGFNRVFAGHDINITTGNNIFAAAFVKALAGAVHTIAIRDINLTGSCSIPNIASIDTFGPNSNLDVQSGRDITLRGKAILELQGSNNYNVRAQNKLSVLDCSEIIGAPATVAAGNYYPADGVYELFYRLNTFVYPDWYLLGSDDFWTRTNYTSP